MSTPPTAPARRTVLATLSIGAVGALSGCSVRRERDAPRLPGIKTQGPPEDETALLRALSSARSLAAAAHSAAGPWAPKLTAMHRGEVTRLEGVIATDGISPPVQQQDSAKLTVAALAAHEVAHLSRPAWAAAVTAEPDNAVMLSALLAAGAAAARTLGTSPDWPGGAPATRVCVALLPSVRAAVYALQVIAARTPAKDRDMVASSVVTMSTARSRLEQAAADAAPPAPQSYRLPIRPDSTATRSQLGRRVLSDVVVAAARAVPDSRRSVPDLKALSREWSDAISLSWRWGVAPVPFPGLAG